MMERTNKHNTRDDMDKKIGYWNCAAGMIKKKHIIEFTLREKNLDLLFIAESEIKTDEQKLLLKIDEYELLTNNTDRSRICVYKKKNSEWIRRKDLESNEHNILAFSWKNKHTVIAFYRDFLTKTGTKFQKFKSLIDHFRQIETKEGEELCLIGDMNVDWKRIQDVTYQLSNYVNELQDWLSEKNLEQIIEDITRKRIVRKKNATIQEESTLDHIYTNMALNIKDLRVEEISNSDHCLICYSIAGEKKKKSNNTFKTVLNWKKYSPSDLREYLLKEDWSVFNQTNDIETLNLHLESTINRVLNITLPKREIRIKGNGFVTSKEIRKIKNRRNLLLKRWKKTKSNVDFLILRRQNRLLSAKINDERKEKIRKTIKQNDSRSLWNAVNKELGRKNGEEIRLTQNGKLLDKDEEIVEAFANFFQTKINATSDLIQEDKNVQHGMKIKRLAELENERIHFTKKDILKVLNDLKPKICSGCDEIPMRIYKDSKYIIIGALERLFNEINTQGRFPGVWKIAKIIPLHKKGALDDVTNYRPISNLVSVAKIYELCLLNYLRSLEERIGLRLLGDHQHGFQRGRSTSTALNTLISKLATQLDNKEYIGLYSCDLTAAFDMLNKDILKQRLTAKGFPDHFITMITSYLSERIAYVSLNETNSMMFDVRLGCIQGSTLGPAVFALFTSPLDEILGDESTLISYADDSVVYISDRQVSSLKERLSELLRKHIFWLKCSGLVVNDSKTELMIMHRSDKLKVEIEIDDDCKLESKKVVKFLGIYIEQNLDWTAQTMSVINKCKKTLYGLRMIRKHFAEKEFKLIINSLLYSRMLYCSEIWLTRNMQSKLKIMITNIHVNAIRLVLEDNQKLYSRNELLKSNILCCPFESAEIHLATFFFGVMHNLDLNDLLSLLTCNIYINERNPHRPNFFISNSKMAKHNPVVNFGIVINNLKFDWYNCDLTVYAFKNKIKTVKKNNERSFV